MEITLPDKDYFDARQPFMRAVGGYWVTGYYQVPSLPARSYVLNGDKTANKSKLKSIVRQIRELNKSGNFRINVIYSATSTLNDWIHGLNICLAMNQKYYTMLGDTLAILPCSLPFVRTSRDSSKIEPLLYE